MFSTYPPFFDMKHILWYKILIIINYYQKSDIYRVYSVKTFSNKIIYIVDHFSSDICTYINFFKLALCEVFCNQKPKVSFVCVCVAIHRRIRASSAITNTHSSPPPVRCATLFFVFRAMHTHRCLNFFQCMCVCRLVVVIFLLPQCPHALPPLVRWLKKSILAMHMVVREHNATN